MYEAIPVHDITGNNGPIVQSINNGSVYGGLELNGLIVYVVFHNRILSNVYKLVLSDVTGKHHLTVACVTVCRCAKHYLSCKGENMYQLPLFLSASKR